MSILKSIKLILVLLTTLLFVSACNESTQTVSEPSKLSTITSEDIDISREAFKNLPTNQRLLIDVRTPEEFSQGYISNAVNIPVSELSAQMDRIIDLAENEDTQIVVYCRSGKRAGRAIEYLASQGFNNLKHLDGDFGGWEAANEVIVKP